MRENNAKNIDKNNNVISKLQHRIFSNKLLGMVQMIFDKFVKFSLLRMHAYIRDI